LLNRPLPSDEEIVKRLKADDNRLFNDLVTKYYTDLTRFALTYVRHKEVAEDLVQDVFVSLWERRYAIQIKTSLEAYLFTAVKYSAINFFNRKFADYGNDLELTSLNHPYANSTEELINSNELAKTISEAIHCLPEKCRVIFDLSRNAGLSYKEIALALNISTKTVETQISIALTRLRAYLGKHWDVLMVMPLLFDLN
jgi:RNA polymerase sigma-70 factor (ECF subfamily)